MKLAKKQLIIFILAFTSILYFGIVKEYSKRFHRNFYGFACIGEYFKAPFIPKDKAFILKKSYGYDGQFFLFAAYDPFIIGNEVKKSMDAPHYRYQRILYPLLTKILSFNIPNLYPYMLVLINVLSILLTIYTLIKILDLFNLHVIYSGLYIFFSGLLLSVFRDLGEPLNLLCIVASYYFFLRNKYLLFFLSLSSALLSRETSLLLLPAFFIFSIKDKKYLMLFSILGALTIFSLWQLYLKLKFGIFPFRGGTSNFDFPLKAMFSYVFSIYKTEGNLTLKIYVYIYSITTFFTYALAIKEIFKRITLFSLSFFILAVFYSFMSKNVWVEPWSFARVFLPLTLLSLLTFYDSKSKIFLLPLCSNFVLFPLILLWEKVLHF